MSEQYKPVIVDSHGYPDFYNDLSKHHIFLTCECLLATQGIMVRRPNRSKWISIECPKCHRGLRIFASPGMTTRAVNFLSDTDAYENDDGSIESLNVRTGSGTKARAYNVLLYRTDIRTANDFVTQKITVSYVKSIRGVGLWTFNEILEFLNRHGIVADYEKDVFVFTKGESK